MKHSLVTSKLTIVLTGLARIWFIKLRREGPLKWEGWEAAMIYRFGTEMWRNNMQRAFDRDRCRPMVNIEPVSWLCKPRRRLEASRPEFRIYRMITHILSQCPPDLSHAIGCRLLKEDDFTESRTIIEEVIQSLNAFRKTYTPRILKNEST